MSHPTRDESGYRHRMRVRIGVNGTKGVLLQCGPSKRTGLPYWKVKLSTGEWMWPADLIIDGPGDRVGTCAECGMRFMTETPEPICKGCDEKLFGTKQRAQETGLEQRVRWRSEERGRGFSR